MNKKQTAVSVRIPSAEHHRVFKTYIIDPLKY